MDAVRRALDSDSSSRAAVNAKDRVGACCVVHMAIVAPMYWDLR